MVKQVTKLRYNIAIISCGGKLMPKVGVRELKNKLSFYLKKVMQGDKIEITNRGEVIAFITSAKKEAVSEEFLDLMRRGVATWSGKKPTGSPRPVKTQGRQLSELIIEDRICFYTLNSNKGALPPYNPRKRKH